jgi:PKD repeat protein
MKKNLFTLVSLIFVCSLQAQDWKKHMADPSRNFYTTQKEFYQDLKQVKKAMSKKKSVHDKDKAANKGEQTDMEQEMPGYELFKRWESYMIPRVYPSGDVRQVTRTYEEYQTYKQMNSAHRSAFSTSTLSSTWAALGPFGDPSGGNTGRVNVLRFDSLASNSLWAATPDGGLWNTTSQGSLWSTNTDLLGVVGCSDLVFEPGNPQVMYLATGDGDAGDSYSIGVLKSLDGGMTWNPSGLSWPVSQTSKIYKLLINPLNKNVLFVASTQGIYRSADAGASWTLVAANGNQVTDLQYRPGDTTVVYAAGTDFYRSSDGGQTFSISSTGLPANTAVDRMSIAVTPANPSFVYIVGSDATNDGFQGFYQSTDAGLTFATKATTPNLLGWVSNGSDVGGQGWYTLSIAASPTNANEVVVGGVNIWRTTTAGTSWSIYAQWEGQGAPYVHADIHGLIYQSGTNLYAGTDGGVFNTNNTGATWSAINGNMNITEMYKIGMSKTNAKLVITGEQDNGTNIYSGGWTQTLGGDGMGCFIDWSNDKVMYGEQYQGSFNGSTDGGNTWNQITTGTSGNGAWVTPWHQDPLTANTIYSGFQQMFKSTNQGNNWTQMGTLPGGTSSPSIIEFAVAPSNPLVLYVIQGGTALLTTINGGTSWTDVTGTLPVSNTYITNVAVKANDPSTAWVTLSGYSNGNKVFVTRDGGTTWTNFSTGLPNLPANCIAYWNGTKEGMYVGCDVGIYYRDSTQSSWVAYNSGLPNSSVFDLQIFYPLGKLRAATFGRGLWEADLLDNGTLPPIASFAADKQQICPGSTVNFTDQSSFAPTAWNWSFPGGIPATSAVQNPSVVYGTAGSYNVTLTCSNANGTNTMTQTVYIQVSVHVVLPLSEGFQAASFPPANWINYDDGSDGLVWTQNTTVGKPAPCTMYDNYDLNASGTRDELRTPLFDVTDVSEKVYFDVAYAQYNATYSDSLAVLISTDCGNTGTLLYLKGGTTLATAPDVTKSIFIPKATQWRTDTISLASYVGQTSLMIAFQNRGYNGQALYLDNINLGDVSNGIINYSDPSLLSVFPNPFSDKVRLDFNQSGENKVISVFDAIGRKLSTTYTSEKTLELDLSNQSSGMYLIMVNVKDGFISRRVLKQ